MNYTPLAMTTALIAVGGAEAARVVRKEKPGMSPVVGGFVLGMFLFAFGMVSEDLAAKLCILIIVASLIKNGIPLFTLLGKA